MNRNVSMFGKTIPVWFLMTVVVGIGSMAIAVGPATHVESAPDIQTASDVKIHLQDVDGKINTNVPISASRAFSPLPINWSEDRGASSTDVSGDITASDATVGSVMITKQKLAFNFVVQTATDATFDMKLDNNSEDTQIFLIKANAPSNVILDMEDNSGVTIHGLTGHNEWLASATAGTAKFFDMEVSVTDGGFYPIVVELLRIG